MTIYHYLIIESYRFNYYKFYYNWSLSLLSYIFIIITYLSFLFNYIHLIMMILFDGFNGMQRVDFFLSVGFSDCRQHLLLALGKTMTTLVHSFSYLTADGLLCAAIVIVIITVISIIQFQFQDDDSAALPHHSCHVIMFKSTEFNSIQSLNCF